MRTRRMAFDPMGNKIKAESVKMGSSVLQIISLRLIHAQNTNAESKMRIHRITRSRNVFVMIRAIFFAITSRIYYS